MNESRTGSPQSAIPVANSKLAMWLFISTEVMFFGALIASFVVMRFASDQWPSHEQVHVVWWIGLINTVILLLSGITVSWAAKAVANDESNNARKWILVSIILGVAFLSVKGFEYSEKITKGIYPRGQRSLVFERPDIGYLAGVAKETKSRIADYETQPDSLDKQELLFRINSGLIDWTQQKVGSTDDELMKQMAIRLLAHQIYPVDGDDVDFQKYLADEKHELQATKADIDIQLGSAEDNLREIQSSLKLIQEGEDSDESTRLEKSATELTQTISRLKKQSKPIETRLDSIDEFGDLTTGINSEHELRLPIVIPGGNVWLNAYYLLTAFHALHVIVGVVLLFGLIFFRLTSQNLVAVENVSLYWHFVDLVWLIIFPLLYLI